MIKPMMLMRGVVFSGMATLLSLAAIPAQAQGYPPDGSYLRTCTNVQAFGDRLLMADCRRADGSWDRTVLRDIDGCRGDIVNANGRLRCGRSPYEGYGSSYEHAPYRPYGSGWGR